MIAPDESSFYADDGASQTALSLVRVNSQPVLQTSVTRWISPLHAKRTNFVASPRTGSCGLGEPGSVVCLLRMGYPGNLHRASPTGCTYKCRARTCAAAGSGSLDVPLQHLPSLPPGRLRSDATKEFAATAQLPGRRSRLQGTIFNVPSARPATWSVFLSGMALIDIGVLGGVRVSD